MSKVYVEFPKHFAALEDLPGYFWHRKEQKLYTMKVTGVLRPLSARKYFNQYPWSKGATRNGELCYRVSKGGFRRTLFVKDLIKMFESKPTVTTIPVEK